MAPSQTILPFGPATPSLDDADDKRARDVAWWAKAILIWLLQVIGVSAAVIFGMFSTLAWQNSEIAKSQADSANLLSMVALCTQLDERDERYHQLCESINIAAQERLRVLAESMFGKLPEPTTTRTFTSPYTSSTSTSQAFSTSTEYSTSSRTTISATLMPTSTPPNSAAPTDVPNTGSDIGVAEKVTAAIGVTMGFITILSLCFLWPTWKKYRRDKARRRGLEG